MTSITIPAGVTIIQNSVFGNCPSLTNVTIPASVTSIGDSAFASCIELASVTIPTDLTSIGSWAFNRCSSLASVTIGNKVNSIGFEAFSFCTSLSAITVDALNTTYSSVDGVLYNKNQTTLIQCPGGKTGGATIPSGVTSIGSSAFSSCTSLSAITVDALNTAYSSVDGVLYNKSQTTLIQCPGGKAGGVTIPSSVTSIGSSAFSPCPSLSAITVDVLNTTYSSVDGILFNKTLTRLIQCPGGKSGSVTIPSSVTSIGIGAFTNCACLTSVTIPTSITSLGSGLFSGCSSLTSVTIPTGVTSIGNSVFSGCSMLPSVTIPSSVTSIAHWSFSGCSSLTEISIPASVTTIGHQAFSSCSSLTGAYFMGNAPSVVSSAFYWTASGFTVYYFNGATGFTSPLWNGYPAVNMGNSSPTIPWLLSNGFAYNSDLQTDPNGDGVNLLMAYALNLDPKRNLSSSMPTVVLGAEEISMTFYGASPGVTYRVETSENLQDWATDGVILSGIGTDGQRTATAVRNSSRRFFRLVVHD
ncbi:MAG: leucine-rich repeat domain-containing protein [Verrucomicrobia bacterium]|nr:leucine-rich repeat domain-containing protein [Verrucomicrobiota bacterium]